MGKKGAGKKPRRRVRKPKEETGADAEVGGGLTDPPPYHHRAYSKYGRDGEFSGVVLATPVSINKGPAWASLVYVIGEGGLPFVVDAVLNGRVECSQWLDLFADLVTPLMIASQYHFWDAQAPFWPMGFLSFFHSTVEALIAANAVVNQAHGETGVTALLLAVKYANLDTVELLIAAGADVTMTHYKAHCTGQRSRAA